MRRVGLTLIVLCVACQVLLVACEAAPHLEHREGLPIAYLEGSPYELGRQHGKLLREQVRQAVGQILSYVRGYLKIPLIRSVAADWWLDRSWGMALPSIPSDYLEELRGLSEGSGVPLRELWRIHALPDRTYACSGLAAWGRATVGGRLVHTRNLDWNMRVGIQRYATVFVVHPRGKHAFVNIGWASFIGVLTGINDRELSIGQIGAETVDRSSRGLPMVLLMRKALESASSVEEAARIIGDSPRTVGANYIVADAKVPTGVAIETTTHYASVFEANDPKEHHVAYAKPILDAVFRGDTAIDSQIRDRQLASRGNPKKPGLEPPGGSAHDIRYLGQAAGVLAHYGRLDAQGAIDIAKAVAPGSNVQSVVFAWPEVWIANADGMTRAAHTTYHRLDLEGLFRAAGSSQ